MKGSFENCSTFTRSYLENLFSNSYEMLKIGNIINILLNTILTITTTLGNGLIIVAILKSPNLQTPSYLLITSLAFTDLLVGLVFHPLQIISSAYVVLGIMRGLCFLVTLMVVFAVGLRWYVSIDGDMHQYRQILGAYSKTSIRHYCHQETSSLLNCFPLDVCFPIFAILNGSFESFYLIFFTLAVIFFTFVC